MPRRHLALHVAPPGRVTQALDRLRAELEIPHDFPPEVLAEAAAAAAAVDLPDRDATDVPLVTIDPPGARDLDQAVHLSRDGEGYQVRYAIAAVSAFVTPGGAVDREAHARGVTVYGPDRSFPLHPPVLSAGSASLLPEVDRPAYLWHLQLAADGTLTDAAVELATVRSRAQLSYAQVQDAHDGVAPLPAAVPGDLPDLLAAVGRARQRRERQRGGVSLDIPEQAVEAADGGYRLAFRAALPVEGWNAQISLATGIAAARMMTAAGVGLVRTLPPADPRDVARLRRTARALGVHWPAGAGYADVLRTLDSADPAHAAFLAAATVLFRGAGYHVLDDEPPAGAGAVAHAAIAAPYAHVTAPLRRLVDRYGLAVCLALSTGSPVPDWVRSALPGLPATMAQATRRAGAYERGAVDALEALVLADRVGQVFDGVVVEADGEGPDRRGTVVLRDPAVAGTVTGADLPVGESVRVRLVDVDGPERRVRFAPA